MQNATSRDCTFARSNQCENFRKSFFTLRNCFQSKYQNATSQDWFLRGVASAKIWQGEFSPCEISSTPPCSLKSTITWSYHLLHLRSHIHDWIFLSPFCICFLSMYMFYILRLYVPHAYILYSTLSVYISIIFCILFPLSRFL